MNNLRHQDEYWQKHNIFFLYGKQFGFFTEILIEYITNKTETQSRRCTQNIFRNEYHINVYFYACIKYLESVSYFLIIFKIVCVSIKLN